MYAIRSYYGSVGNRGGRTEFRRSGGVRAGRPPIIRYGHGRRETPGGNGCRGRMHLRDRGGAPEPAGRDVVHEKSIGAEFHVITSYSIHYTKLYEVIEAYLAAELVWLDGFLKDAETDGIDTHSERAQKELIDSIRPANYVEIIENIVV